MASFTDNAGRNWRVNLTVSAVKRVRDLCDFDLLAEDLGAMVLELASDIVKVVDILYVICQPEANERGVTDEQFGEGLAGDALQLGADALIDCLVEFMPKKKRREYLRKTWEAINDAMEKTEQAALEVVESEAMGKLITTNIEKAKAEAMAGLIAGE